MKLMEHTTMFDQFAEWHNMRLGKFTASEVGKLMKKGRGKDAYFGETAYSYIKGKLAEIVTQQPLTDLEGMRAIEWGTMNEYDAVQLFEQRSGMKVEYFGKTNPKFYPFAELPDFAGGSPDGLTEDAVIEVKAPFNSANHIGHLLLNTGEDLKEEKPDYYAQCQFNMVCTGKRLAYFISYDPRMLQTGHQLHAIPVPYDEPFCIDLSARIMEAVKLLQVYLDCIDRPSVLLAHLDQETGATIVEGA